jgi:putative RNA 2'-phosphotransferase
VRYEWADRVAVDAVFATDPKGRFEREGESGAARNPDATSERVRAAYGHSVDVGLEAGGGSVPVTLYHGTAPRHLESILAEGLRPMGRQQVHRSGTVQAARQIGRRHADEPLVFASEAAALQAAGLDVTRRGEGVYTTDLVPPVYLAERSLSDRQSGLQTGGSR